MTTTARTVEAVWRIEAARLVGALVRQTGDVELAEDLAQDALVAALEQWPVSGVPTRPGGWLLTVARRRAVDDVRRRVAYEARLTEIGRSAAVMTAPHEDLELDAHVEDDVLRLVFLTCHPQLSAEARVALTLRLVAGLTTEEVARAQLVPVSTVAARITRAKKALRTVPVERPVGDELAPRLRSVLEVVYLIFNEGYAATSGTDRARPELCEEAMRLGRVLAALAPDEPEVLGLLALLEVQASRLRARVGPDGKPVTLLEQDRSRWDRLLISHALAALERALAQGGAGPYVLQASIAACHARAVRAADTDWARIASLYGELAAATRSPVVELNRAMAVVDGRRAGRRAAAARTARGRARRIPPTASRPRRSAGPAWTARRGRRSVPAGGGDDGQRGRAAGAARARRPLARVGSGGVEAGLRALEPAAADPGQLLAALPQRQRLLERRAAGLEPGHDLLELGARGLVPERSVRHGAEAIDSTTDATFVIRLPSASRTVTCSPGAASVTDRRAAPSGPRASA